MLQQTQVERVLKKYGPFIRTLPDFAALSRAPLKEVLGLWQGLGYNRRAFHLQQTAKAVISGHGGVLPDTEKELVCLPGIGKATAGAILAFAFHRPSVFIETNIRRVFIHFFFPDRTDVRDDEILPLVKRTLDRKDPRRWYYALMDYGAMLGKDMHNPNRRSAHYARQAPFPGSDRQVRGRVVRELLEAGPLTDRSLSSRLGVEAGRLRLILAGLEREGLVVRTGRRFSLP